MNKTHTHPGSARKFSRTHYEALAAYVRVSYPDNLQAREVVAEWLIRFFAADNPAFSKATFMNACRTLKK